MLDVASWDLDALSAEWRAARPFPHVILDGALAADALDRLRQACAREPHRPNRSDFYEMMASTEPPAHPTLRAVAEELASPAVCAAVARLSGKPVSRADLRSFVYLAGSYLLPHSDWRYAGGDTRQVAYVYYLLPAESIVGGELELYDCDLSDGEIAHTAVAKTIVPAANRLVLFDVSQVSLHAVREVLAGGRLSLSGWFYA